MKLFGKHAHEHDFKSNNKTVELIPYYGNNEFLEDEIELRRLYRNVENILFNRDGALILYKDLKVRTKDEVQAITKKLKEDANLV